MDTKQSSILSFDADEARMLFEAVGDKIWKLQQAIAHREQTQLKMEARLEKWQRIERKLKQSVGEPVGIINTRVFFNRIEYHVEHSGEKLGRILLLDHDVTSRFDAKDRDKFMRLALRVERGSNEGESHG